MGTGPLQVRGEVVSLRPVGAYHRLTLSAPGVAERTRPGQFAALAIGDDDTAPAAQLLRRAFSIHRADTTAEADTVEVVLAVHGAGTGWLSRLRPGDTVDVVAPLGRPFELPAEPVPCVLVGGGYGSAPLFALAHRLRRHGCDVHLVLGAATAERLYGVVEAERVARSATVTTDDGSAGVQGLATDPLPELIARTGSRVLYACGPMAMLAAVSRVASAHGVQSQCAVEESMACGIGVCMTCVLPVVGDDGRTQMARSCVDGPVFAGDRVRWADVHTIPADAVGAPPPTSAAVG